MSIVHLSMVDRMKADSEIYRELAFFTTGISDLYSKRDDLADDDSAESHISEYMCVSQFADRLEVAYSKIFSVAAYLALRRDIYETESRIDNGDIEEVIRVCDFVEVFKTTVAGTASESEASSEARQRGIYFLLELVFSSLRSVS